MKGNFLLGSNKKNSKMAGKTKVQQVDGAEIQTSS